MCVLGFSLGECEHCNWLYYHVLLVPLLSKSHALCAFTESEFKQPKSMA